MKLGEIVRYRHSILFQEANENDVLTSVEKAYAVKNISAEISKKLKGMKI